MAPSDRTGSSKPSGFDQLLNELSGFISAQADQLADKATDKLSDVTGQLQDVSDNKGSFSDVAGIGGRLLQGDSPLKAFAGQKFGNLKDKVTEAFGGGKGKGRKSGGGKLMNIVEVLDVGLPLRTVYDHWTQYEDFSGFAKGVRDVSAATTPPATGRSRSVRPPVLGRPPSKSRSQTTASCGRRRAPRALHAAASPSTSSPRH